MTVSSTTNRKTYAGNGVTTSFATSPVVFFDTSDLVVTAVTDATGATETLVENTDYTVSGGSGSTGTVDTSGGTSPYGAPASGVTLVILRVLPLTQADDFVNNDINDAEVLEDNLDKLVMIDQQQSEEVGRALKVPSSEGAQTEIDVAGKAGYYLRRNVGGTAFELVAGDPNDTTFTQSGTGGVEESINTTLGRIKYPQQFGATGDGAANDTTAWDNFMAALGSGATGVVPPNTWIRYTNTAIKTYSDLEDIHLIFGPNSGVIFTDNTKGGFNFDGGSNIRIEGMQLDYVSRPTGARVGTDQHAIKFQDITGDLDLIGVKALSSPNMGIVAVNCASALVKNCRAYNTLADGIHMKDTPCTIIDPQTNLTGDDGVATPRTVAGGLTSMKVAILGARVTNAGARGIAVNGATDVMLSDYIVNNTSQHGITVARDETSSLATPQRVFIGKGRIDNAGQYTYTATTPTKGGHGVYLIGGDDSNEITIDGPSIYNANGHGISITESASGNIGTVNIGNFTVDTTAVLTDGSNTPGRGVNVASVKKLNLFGKGVAKNCVGAGFFALDFDQITGELPDVINCNTGATYNDNPNFIKFNNTNGTGQVFCDGGNVVDTQGTPDSTTVEVDGATTGYAVGFMGYRGDGGALLLSNITDAPSSFLLSGNNDLNERQSNSFSAANGGTTTLSTGRRRNINTNASTIASHTLRLPTVTTEGHLTYFSTNGEITSLTVNAANGTSTVKNAPTTLSSGGYFTYQYRIADDTWYRTG